MAVLIINKARIRMTKMTQKSERITISIDVANRFGYEDKSIDLGVLEKYDEQPRNMILSRTVAGYTNVLQ